MELAWFLTGAAKAVLADPAQKETWDHVVHASYDLLKRNQAPTGFFGHLATGTGPAGWLRGRIGSFADQVYPIQALARYHLAVHDDRALEIANSCAAQICRLQGDGGQWWWHYDARNGSVIEGYPVYSVHQDAMAPMALLDLFDAGGTDFNTTTNPAGGGSIAGTSAVADSRPEFATVLLCRRT